MPLLVNRTPTYRRHRPSGQAVVTLNGRDFYLGPYGTKASKAEYDRLVGEWLAAGRCLPRTHSGSDLTVAELGAGYLRFAKGYYRDPDGAPTSSMNRVHLGLRALRQSHATLPACEFGPLCLQAIQNRLAKQGNSRAYVNHLTEQIKRVFRWGVRQQLVPITVYQALTTVPGLRRGRSEASEPAPVKPVDDAVVEATLPYLPAPIDTMVRLQRLTGCRPQDVCRIRPADLDRTSNVWKYTPQAHKTSYRGDLRVIYLGPKAQAILRPWLLRDAGEYCFVPRETRRKLDARRRENRQTPMTPSQARRRPKRAPKRPPGDCYSTHSYTNAIRRALKLANAERSKAGQSLLPHWTPLQLRHTAATAIRRDHGLEAAQVILGHAKADVTQVYAERHTELGRQVMAQIG